MDVLYIDATKNTPVVHFNPDTGLFWIEGKSHPENIRIFFAPIMDWLDGYLEQIKSSNDRSIALNLKYTYLNSASFKYLVELIRKIFRFQAENIKVMVYWHYDIEDDDMKETGIELFEMSEIKLPYELIPYSEE